MKGRKILDSQTLLFNDILKDCHAIRNMLKFIKKMQLSDSEKVNINLYALLFE